MFLAHSKSIKPGEFIPLEQFNKERVLTKGAEPYMLSNICLHQNSLMASEPCSKILACPYHNWQYDSKGMPVSSGETEYYCKNSKKLKTFPVYEWSNLLFSCPVPFAEKIDLSNIVLVEHRIDQVKSDPEHIMSVFLDVDHIPVLHEGVYESVGFDTVTVQNVDWSFYNNGSVQTVKDNAMWAAVYPNTMVEWQGGAVFITVAMQAGDRLSNVIVYKYRHKDMSDYEWMMNERAWETAWLQDRSQAERILGRAKPTNLEPAKKHYIEWLKK